MFRFGSAVPGLRGRRKQGENRDDPTLEPLAPERGRLHGWIVSHFTWFSTAPEDRNGRSATEHL